MSKRHAKNEKIIWALNVLSDGMSFFEDKKQVCFECPANQLQERLHQVLWTTGASFSPQSAAPVEQPDAVLRYVLTDYDGESLFTRAAEKAAAQNQIEGAGAQVRGKLAALHTPTVGKPTTTRF